jgi:tripartite-type tricarboxylate transporter receptor subunit TctC
VNNDQPFPPGGPSDALARAMALKMGGQISLGSGRLVA